MVVKDEFTKNSKETVLKKCSALQKAALAFFQHGPGVYLGKFLFGMLGEITLHHPVVVLRFCL